MNERAEKTALGIGSLALLLADFGLMALIWLTVTRLTGVIRELGVPVSPAMRVVIATPAILGILTLALFIKEWYLKKTISLAINGIVLLMLIAYYVFSVSAISLSVHSIYQYIK